MQVIGILDSASPESRGEELAAFHRGLAKAGVDGRNTRILYSWANNDYGQLPTLADELVNNKVAVIVAAGGPVSALAAQAATRQSNTPVVFTPVTDPRKSGLVGDLKKPGGNLTGTLGFTSELDGERMSVLSELIGKKKAGAIAVLANPNRPYPTHADFAKQTKALEVTAAKKAQRSAVVLGAGTEAEIDQAFKTLKGLFKTREVVGLAVTADPFLASRRVQIVTLADRLGIPAIYQWPSFVVDGGLMSFGPSKAQAYEFAGDYVGQILSGKRVGDLPVRKTNKFDLVIGAAAAKKLRLKVPRKVAGHDVKLVTRPK
jgi:putative ABC transport system substrate-binding protein